MGVVSSLGIGTTLAISAGVSQRSFRFDRTDKLDEAERPSTPSPGKRPLTAQLAAVPAPPAKPNTLQLRSAVRASDPSNDAKYQQAIFGPDFGVALPSPDAAVQTKGAIATDGVRAHQLAAAGTRGAGGKLPHLDTIQRSFGRFDVSGVRAYTDGDAAAANQALGSSGYAFGESVAFSGHPDLHTAAHEAAHVVQQRAGVSLKGGVGSVGDRYERHADTVADLVVAGKSAEGELARMAPRSSGIGAPAVQRKGGGDAPEVHRPTLAREYKAAYDKLPLGTAFEVAVTFSKEKRHAAKSGGGGLKLIDAKRSTELNLRKGKITKKLKIALASGALTLAEIHGVKIEVGGKFAEFSAEKDSAKMDLFPVELKVKGDISDWLRRKLPRLAPKGLKVEVAFKVGAKINGRAIKDLQALMELKKEIDAARKASKQAQASLRATKQVMDQRRALVAANKAEATADLLREMRKLGRNPPKNNKHLMKWCKKIVRGKPSAKEAIAARRYMTRHRAIAELARKARKQRKQLTKLAGDLAKAMAKEQKALRQIAKIRNGMKAPWAKKLATRILKRGTKRLAKFLTGIGALMDIVEVARVVYVLKNGGGFSLEGDAGWGTPNDGKREKAGAKRKAKRGSKRKKAPKRKPRASTSKAGANGRTTKPRNGTKRTETKSPTKPSAEQTFAPAPEYLYEWLPVEARQQFLQWRDGKLRFEPSRVVGQRVKRGGLDFECKAVADLVDVPMREGLRQLSVRLTFEIYAIPSRRPKRYPYEVGTITQQINSILDTKVGGFMQMEADQPGKLIFDLDNGTAFNKHYQLGHAKVLVDAVLVANPKRLVVEVTVESVGKQWTVANVLPRRGRVRVSAVKRRRLEAGKRYRLLLR